MESNQSINQHRLTVAELAAVTRDLRTQVRLPGVAPMSDGELLGAAIDAEVWALIRGEG